MNDQYTVKELTSIEGQHDVYHCNQPDCPTCKAFWEYATRLREQAERKEPGRLSTKEWISARYLDGMTVREIAFNVDWPDDKVIKYLTAIKLYKHSKRPHRRVRPEPVQIELKIGDQSGTITVPYQQAHMAELIWAGLSVQAIARRLKISATAVKQYIRTHDIPKVQQQAMTLYDVTYNADSHRYFDKYGNEYQLTRMENEQ